MSVTPVMTGGCQCGAVRYALHAQPEGSFCHCRMCQRAVGGPFAALTCLSQTDLEWTKGAPKTYASSSIATRGFCADCGTPLTFAYNTGGYINVTVGSLDEPEHANIVEHFGIESRLSWLKMCAGLPEQATDADGDRGDERAAMHVYPDKPQ